MPDARGRPPSGPLRREPVAARVTYCGNVHPAESLEAWLGGLARWAAPVARAVGGSKPFALGVWWPAEVARALARDREAQARARAALAGHDLSLGTVNAFPYGGFHDVVVKTAVYRPDWADPRRVEFTLDVARAACALAPSGAEVALSTLPLGFGGGDLVAMRRNLAATARRLAELAADTGVACVLALEPEPACLVETTAEARACLEAVFHEHGDDGALRRHLGVCLDLCHLAVVGEDPLTALAALRHAGVAVPKIQVSSCLEVRGEEGLPRLLAHDEPRYLHQTVGTLGGGSVVRALDLGDVARRRAEFRHALRVRTHFHVPLFWDDPGPLGSTRAEVERFLAGLPAPWPILEAETYTWGVLPRFAAGADEDLVAGLAREIAFVQQHLARAGTGA